MITLPDKKGLRAYLEGLGWTFRVRDGAILSARTPEGVEDDAALTAVCTAYDDLAEAKREARVAIKADGLARIQAIFPAIENLDELKLVSNIIQSIAPAARTLTPDIVSASAIYQAALAAIAAVNAAATREAVEGVVPVWP